MRPGLRWQGGCPRRDMQNDLAWGVKSEATRGSGQILRVERITVTSTDGNRLINADAVRTCGTAVEFGTRFTWAGAAVD